MCMRSSNKDTHLDSGQVCLASRIRVLWACPTDHAQCAPRRLTAQSALMGDGRVPSSEASILRKRKQKWRAATGGEGRGGGGEGGCPAGGWRGAGRFSERSMVVIKSPYPSERRKGLAPRYLPPEAASGHRERAGKGRRRKRKKKTESDVYLADGH
jgi:hypothetical protein